MLNLNVIQVSSEYLSKLEKLAKHATKGNWEVYYDSNLKGYEIEIDGGYKKIVSDYGGVHEERDAEYIAAANPSVMLMLIAEIKRARKRK